MVSDTPGERWARRDCAHPTWPQTFPALSESLVGSSPLGDVLKNTVGLPKLSLWVSSDFAVKRHQNSRSVLPYHLELDARNLPHSLEPGEGLFEMALPVRVQEVGEVSADDLLFVVAE